MAEKHPSLARLRIQHFYRRPFGKAILLLAFLTLLVLVCGVIVWGVGDFPHYGSAIWWAVEHLLDPSRIGNDDEVWERVLGLVLVVVGLVAVLGVVLDGFSGLLDRGLKREAESLDTLPAEGHLVFVGWREGLPELARSLEHRVRARGIRTVVVLPEEQRTMGPTRSGLLRKSLRRPFGLVYGDPGSTETLARARAGHGDIVVFCAPDLEGRTDEFRLGDVATVKAAIAYEDLVAAQGSGESALVVVELRTEEAIDVAGAWLPSRAHVLVRGRVISALMAMALAEDAWTVAMFRILGMGAEPTRVRIEAGLFKESFDRFDEDESLLPLAYLPAAGTQPELSAFLDRQPLGREVAPSVPPAQRLVVRETAAAERRVLILGWNPTLERVLTDLVRYRRGSVAVTVLAREGTGISPDSHGSIDGVPVDVVHANPTDPRVLTRIISDVRPHRIAVVSSSDQSSPDQADAETVLVLLGLHRLTGGGGVLVRPFDPDSLGSSLMRSSDVLLVQEIATRLLEAIVEEPRMSEVSAALLRDPGASFRTFTWESEDRRAAARFADLARAVHGQTGGRLVGWAGSGSGRDLDVHVAPPPDTSVPVEASLLVLTSQS